MEKVNKINMKKIKIISSIFYIIAILILLVYTFIEIRPNIYLNELTRLILLISTCIFIYIGGFIISKYTKTNKAMKINLWIFFILYLILLISLTLFDPLWNRTGFKNINFSKSAIERYLNSSFNIIPFKTIKNYIRQFNSIYSTSSVMFNLLGNFVAFSPLSIFLPLIFKKQNKFHIFLITITLIVLSIEISQFITFSGSCDIDDLILNVSGALIMYLFIKIKPVNNLIKNILLLEKNKISKLSIIIISIVIFFVLTLGIILVKYRQKLYNNNLNIYNKIYNPNIDIYYNENCSDNNLFYQDKVFNYYFECYDADSFYLIINDKETYTIKEVLDNTNYKISLGRILNILENNNIHYKKIQR